MQPDFYLDFGDMNDLLYSFDGEYKPCLLFDSVSIKFFKYLQNISEASELKFRKNAIPSFHKF